MSNLSDDMRVALRQMTPVDEVKYQARKRKAFRTDPAQRPLSENYQEIGMAGEFAFGEWSGIYPDVELRTYGDGGVDFTIPLLFTVDVKTAARPISLLHEVGKPVADIYVLAGYDKETGRASLLGWEWGANVANAPAKDFGHGVINHYINREDLRPMSELEARLASIRRLR